MRSKISSRNTVRNTPGLIRLSVVVGLLLFIFGCAPSYPKETLDKSIRELCKREYSVDVEVKLVGKTVGVYIPIDELLEDGESLSPAAIKRVDKVIMGVSRVLLSTDADIDFYVLIAQDPVIPQLQFVVIGYIEDRKRALATYIAKSDYFDRLIKELRLTPQALLRKKGTTKSSTISSIGYWNKEFFLEDIKMSEFLTKQTEDRIRNAFLRNSSLKNLRSQLVKGAYKDGALNFKVVFTTEKDAPNTTDQTQALKSFFKIISDMLYRYNFSDYSSIEISLNDKFFMFTKEDVESLKKRKVRLEDLI